MTQLTGGLTYTAVTIQGGTAASAWLNLPDVAIVRVLVPASVDGDQLVFEEQYIDPTTPSRILFEGTVQAADGTNFGLTVGDVKPHAIATDLQVMGAGFRSVRLVTHLDGENQTQNATRIFYLVTRPLS